MLFVFIVYVIGIIFILYVNCLQPQWYDCADLITPLTITLISFILPLFLVSEITHKSTSKKFSPEQFARDFEEIVKNRKVLIFIDDIDRCSCDEIKSTFDTLKTFILDENYDVKFIIPIDPNILFNALENQTYDYFSKIIDYPIEIKNYTKVKFEPLKDEILVNVESEYKDIVSDGLYLASKFYIDTPRKMKKFANEFINEIYNYKPKEITDKGYMFAKLIILKNEFPKYYHNLITNYNTVIDITRDEIDNYKSKEYTESSKTKKGIKFNNELLDFLSKTDNVDLYNFPMYENNISYEEYKIKALCEDPIIKNKFDDNAEIDLNQNSIFLDYEINENIINKIKTKRFLYSDLLKRICFIIIQFMSQKNNHIFNKHFNNIINTFSYIKEDKNLFITEKINEENIKHINIKYINDCLSDYIKFLKERNESILDNKLINCMLEFINENIENDFDYIVDDLNSFVDEFENCKDIENKEFIKIIEKYLSKDFGKYHNKFSWYFELSSSSGDKCYVTDIINSLKNEIELNEDVLEKYLIERYKKIDCSTYFKQVLNNIDVIINNPDKYKIIINPLIENISGKRITFDDIDGMLSKTGLISSNEIINKLILKLVFEMRKALKFNSDRFNDILLDIGIEYNKLDLVDDQLKKIVENCNIDEIKLLFGYDDSKKSFQNFNLLKKCGNIFKNKSNNLLEIISNSYCEFEDYVLISDLESHGIDLVHNKDRIIDLINSDLNCTIYLANNLSKDDLNKIKYDDLDITKIDLENVNNKEIISQISNQIKIILDDCIREMNNNKDNKYEVKQQMDKFLIYSEKLYCDISYSDKTLWTRLKKTDNIIGYCELIDDYYLPKLREHEKLVQLFYNGKYKDNYLKDNIYSSRILDGLK